MRGKGFAAGLGVGVLAGSLVIVASLIAGGGTIMAPASPQVTSSGSAQTMSTTTMTSTVTYSSATVPGTQQSLTNATNNGGESFSATGATARGTFVWHIAGIPVSSSLSSLPSQTTSANLLILLPLAFAILAGAAFYRFAGKKETVD